MTITRLRLRLRFNKDISSNNKTFLCQEKYFFDYMKKWKIFFGYQND